VGGLKRQEAAGVTNLLGKRRAYRWTPTRQLQLVAQCVGTFVERQTDTLMDDVLPALRDAGVHLYNYYELEPEVCVGTRGGRWLGWLGLSPRPAEYRATSRCKAARPQT
jgi:hypothetical protein